MRLEVWLALCKLSVWGLKSFESACQQVLSSTAHCYDMSSLVDTCSLPPRPCRQYLHVQTSPSFPLIERRDVELAVQVPLPRSTEALRWLRGQPCSPPQLMPRIYFSPRHLLRPRYRGRGSRLSSCGWLWSGCRGGQCLDLAGMHS